MKNLLMLLALISIGLTAPALADAYRGDRVRNDHRGEREYIGETHHDRGDKYQRFQKRMKHLRKELRHERRENRRLERREARRSDRYYRRGERHAYRNWRRSAPVFAQRYDRRPWFFPSLVVRIPLNW